MPFMLLASKEKKAGSGSPFGGKSEDEEESSGGFNAKAEAAEILGLDDEKAKALEAFIKACK